MKRLLLLSSLVFGLALSGCGNDPNGTGNDPTKAKLGETCTKEKACNTGLACVAKANNANEGTCETACKNGACSGANQKCETGIAGLEGKTVDVCRAESGQNHEKATLGQPCSKSKQCANELVCVADANETKKGTCYDACLTNNKCAKKADVCVEVDGLNNKKEKACRTPPPVMRKEGEECREKEKCEDGTICLAKHASEKVGVCTKTKECTQKGDCGTDECLEERILGGKTLKVCLPKWCKDSSECDAAKNEYCSASPSDLTRGHCRKIECDITAQDCNADKTCVKDEFALGTPPAMPTYCIDKSRENLPRLAFGHCDPNTPCQDPRLICAHNTCTVPCDVPGFQTQCHFGIPHVEWCIPGQTPTDPMFCGPASITPEEWRSAQVGDECGKTQMCDVSKDLRCHIPKGKDKGTCIKLPDMKDECLDDTNCKLPGETCKYLYEPGTIIGSVGLGDDFFTSGFKTCQK